MNTFFVKHRLTSCTVDKELIAGIENFIVNEAKEYLSSVEVNGEAIGLDAPVEELLHIIIQSKSGSDKLSSISEYIDPFLPDDLQTVIIDFNSYKNAFLNIRVVFHSSFSEHPVIEISMHGENLRETAANFVSGINALVNKKRNNNHWFHNRTLLLSILFVYTLWNIMNFFMMNFSQGTGPAVVYNNILFNFLFALLTVWIIISIFLRPYITFKTRKQGIITLGYSVFSLIYLLMVIVLFYTNFNKQ